MRIWLGTILALSVAGTASAHVTVWPEESKAGVGEKYTMRVPTEGKVATTSVDLEVPEGLTILAFAAPSGWTYETMKKGDRIVSVTWKMEVKPGEFVEFAFMARNPKDAKELRWNARQHFADGTVSEWNDKPGARGGASVTKLTGAVPATR